jgi:LysM repeat protein
MSSINHIKDLRSIMEGKKTHHQELLEIFEDHEYKQIYLEWHSMGTVLTEAKITQDQIQQIFKAVADGAAAGNNVDAPGAETTPAGSIPKRGILGSMSSAWLKLKEKISQSNTVSGFDVKFDQAQQKILGKLGGKGGVVGQTLQKYKDFATKYPKMQGAIWAAVAVLAGMSGWGLAMPAITFAIRTIDRLLQGDRLSGALWKGFKAGALTFAAGEVADFVKGPPQAPVDTSGYPMWADPYHSGDIVPSGGTQYTVQPNDTISTLAQKFNVSSGELLKANPDMYNPANPNDLAAGAKINIPAATGSPVYQGGVGTAADTAAKVASGQYTPSRYGIKESILDMRRIKSKWQIQESLKLPQRSKPYITQWGVSKIFESISEAYINEESYDDYVNRVKKSKELRDKFDLFWRKNYREYSQEESVDVDTVIDFLRRMGMKDGFIKSTFDELKIPMADVTPDTPPTEPTTPTEPTPGPTPVAPGPTVPPTAPTEPAPEPEGPKPGTEIEYPGSMVKFKYTPQWLMADGKPAGEAAAKVLNQLASGVKQSDMNINDIISGRRQLYKGAPGMTESKKIAKKQISANKQKSKKVV